MNCSRCYSSQFYKCLRLQNQEQNGPRLTGPGTPHQKAGHLSAIPSPEGTTTPAPVLQGPGQAPPAAGPVQVLGESAPARASPAQPAGRPPPAPLLTAPPHRPHSPSWPDNLASEPRTGARAAGPRGAGLGRGAEPRAPLESERAARSAGTAAWRQPGGRVRRRRRQARRWESVRGRRRGSGALDRVHAGGWELGPRL